MVPIVLAVTLSFTLSPYEATVDCTESTTLETYGAVRLYGAPRYSDGMPRLIRSKPVTLLSDTLIVEDAGGWSYWLTGVDLAGNEACSLGPGVTVGVPTVEVPNDSGPEGTVARKWWVDLSGRRLRTPPTTAGVYWEVQSGKKIKLVILK